VARSARSDPFTPGFGNLPVVFAGRDREFDDLAAMVDRLAYGVYEQPRIITGDRGMGKTSLLLHFEAEQREAGRWVVRAPATKGDGAVVARLCRGLAELRRAHDLLGALADAGRRALERLAGIGLSPTKGLSFDLTPAGDAAATGDDLRALLEAVARPARDHGTVLLLLIDEAQSIELSTLGQVFYAIQEVQGVTVDERDPDSGALRRDSLPLGVVVAGLPGLVGRLKRAGSTFGERSKPHRLSALDRAPTVVALRAFATEGGAVFDADALDIVLDASGGYPYFLHVVGSAVWRAGTGDVITVDDARLGVKQARPYLDEFYRQRLTEVGLLQRDYLRAAAGVAPAERTPGAVAAELGRTSNQLGSTLNALVDSHGLLRHNGAGLLVFALPGLDEHLRSGT
jgi:hypothetical protein